MNSNQSKNIKIENKKSTLLPKTFTIFQIFFSIQVFIGLVIILIALPLGINLGAGFWIYDIVGILGYLLSIIVLIIALIFLSINANRVGVNVLDSKMNKSSAIIAGSIFIALTLIGINIANISLYNTGTADKMAIGFALGNILSFLILGLMIENFDKMLVHASRYPKMEKGYRFMKLRPLVVIPVIWVIIFTIATPLFFNSTGNITPRVEFIEITNFIGMLIFGGIGLVVIYFLKEKWLREFKKRAILLSKK
jgi:hypothetical protein